MSYILSAIDEHIRKGDIVVTGGAVGGMVMGNMDGYYFLQLLDAHSLVFSSLFLWGIGKLCSVFAFGVVGGLGGQIIKYLYPKIKSMFNSRMDKINNSLKKDK